MKIKVLGFSWLPNVLPSSVPAFNVFNRISEVSGVQYNDFIGAATRQGEWWAGVLLKVRDSRALTTLKKHNGVLVFAAEKLADGTAVAEPNFFIAHESNGHGLYCHHYHSASMMGDFGYYCYHRFAELCEARIKQEIETPGMTQSQRNQTRKRYRGRLVLEQIVKPGSFDDHVKSLKKITKLDANLVSFEFKDSMFNPLIRYAKRKKVALLFDSNADHQLLAESITECRQAGAFDRARVEGFDAKGDKQVWRTTQDATVFSEYDYDDMVAALTLRFDALAESIQESSLIKKLIEIGSTSRVRAALGIGV